MSWPTPQDFNEAIQNPRLAFSDPELQNGQPQLNALGLPQARSGAFASVYRMTCGSKTWAVRCFMRELKDHQERYAAISQYLVQARLQYTVGFTFLQQGIRVNRQWYPILKMEWVQGEALDAYVERNLSDPPVLRALAERWVRMLWALKNASIAHGDLQHGNVLVVNGDFKLIDYDGMFVPRLAGKGSIELGHRNYQHPRRTEADFGPHLDHFSAWVIYASLLALSIDPGMWQEFKGDNECLLFKREDFETPAQSDALRHALKLLDKSFPAAGEALRTLPTSRVDNVVPLDAGALKDVAVDRGSSDWMTDHVRFEGPKRPTTITPGLVVAATGEVPTVPDSPTAPAAYWLLDYVEPKAPTGATFARSPLLERLALLGTIVALVFAFMPWGPLAALATVCFMLWRYRTDPAVRKRWALDTALRAIADTVHATERNIESGEQLKRARNDFHRGAETRLSTQYQALVTENKIEFNAIQGGHRKVIFALNQRRKALDKEEAQALNQVEGKIIALQQQMLQADADEAAERAVVLNVLRAKLVIEHLRRFPIEHAPISGIGDQLKAQLRAAGYKTAGDITPAVAQKVAGIGPARTALLLSWRQELDDAVQSELPTSLTGDESREIRRKFVQHRRLLEMELEILVQRRAADEAAVRVRFKHLRERIEVEEAEAKVRFGRDADSLRERYAKDYLAVQDRLEDLRKETAQILRNIDVDVTEARRAIFASQWEKEKLARELKFHERIRFTNYMMRVTVGRN